MPESIDSQPQGARLHPYVTAILLVGLAGIVIVATCLAFLIPLVSTIFRSAPTGDALYASPAIADGVVYIASLDHRLYAYHLAGTVP